MNKKIVGIIILIGLLVYLVDGLLIKPPPDSWREIKWGTTIDELQNMDVSSGIAFSPAFLIPCTIYGKSEYWELEIYIGKSKKVESVYGYYKGFSLFHKTKIFIKKKQFTWD